MLTTPVEGNQVEEESEEPPFDQNYTIPKSWMKQEEQPQVSITDKEIKDISDNCGSGIND